MMERGSSPDALRLVRDAYLLAMQLYSGMYTGSGKTTLAHEVGTASLALRHGAPAELVAAGLLQGAYVVGDWGRYRRGIDPRDRDEVRRAAGARAEACVFALASLDWTPASISGFAERGDALDATER